MKRSFDQASLSLEGDEHASTAAAASVVNPPPDFPLPLVPEIWLMYILPPLLATFGVRTRIMVRRTSTWFRDNVAPRTTIDWLAFKLEVEGFTRENFLAPLSWQLRLNDAENERYYESLLKCPLKLGRPAAFWMTVAAVPSILSNFMDEWNAIENVGRLVTAAAKAPDDRVVETLEFMRRLDLKDYWASWLVDYVLNKGVFQKRRWVVFKWMVESHFDCWVDYLIKSEWWDDFGGQVDLCQEILEQDGDPRWVQLYFPRLLQKEAFVEHFKANPLIVTMSELIERCK